MKLCKTYVINMLSIYQAR